MLPAIKSNVCTYSHVFRALVKTVPLLMGFELA